MPFAHHFNDFLFGFTTCNLPHVLVNGPVFSVLLAASDAFMGIDPLPWLPKGVLFLEPERHCGGLQRLPLGTPIYCHPGLYSVLHLQPSLIHFVFLGQAGWETLLLIGERMARRQAERCLGLWSACSRAQLRPPVHPSSSSASARQLCHVGVVPLQALHSFSAFVDR